MWLLGTYKVLGIPDTLHFNFISINVNCHTWPMATMSDDVVLEKIYNCAMNKSIRNCRLYSTYTVTQAGYSGIEKWLFGCELSLIIS